MLVLTCWSTLEVGSSSSRISGSGGQGAGDVDPLPLPAGQLADGAMAQVEHLHAAQRFGHDLIVLGRVAPQQAAFAQPAHARHVPHADGKVAVELHHLGHVADVPASPCGRSGP